MAFPASSNSQAERELPLLLFTPAGWAEQALVDEIALLNDHAHLEKKAGQNALQLLHRWPDVLAASPPAVQQWTDTLQQIAEEEIDHLRIVLGLLHDRGGLFTKSHRNQYAGDLRDIERRGADPADLIDRLLVSALIEARSCERFLLLGNRTEKADLRKLFCGLWSSEHGHYRSFIALAKLFATEQEVDQRWQEVLQLEAAILARQPAGPRMHSWLAG